jgi:hypothetical protein
MEANLPMFQQSLTPRVGHVNRQRSQGAEKPSDLIALNGSHPLGLFFLIFMLSRTCITHTAKNNWPSLHTIPAIWRERGSIAEDRSARMFENKNLG